MAVLVTDLGLESRLKAERELSGGDRFDEVWEGTYVMSPLADDEHQRIQFKLALVFQSVLGLESPAKVRAGVNVSDREVGWERNYRCPDVAVFLPGTSARNCGTHWVGGPDLAVEVMSRYDRTREKMPFYADLGVRELWLVDRNPWGVELHRLEGGVLRLVGRIVPDRPGDAIASSLLPVSVSFGAGGAERPMIVAARTDTRERWEV